MGREIRRVPENWEHPKKIDKYNGGLVYKALIQRDFNDECKEFEKELKVYRKEQKEFNGGKEFSFKNNDGIVKRLSKKLGNFYEDWAGEIPTPPNPDDYMPTGKWFQLFESVSEGTPISPPFASKRELIEWLGNNKDFWGTQWNREAAKDIVESGYAMSGIFDGKKFYKPNEQYLLKN